MYLPAIRGVACLAAITLVLSGCGQGTDDAGASGDKKTFEFAVIGESTGPFGPAGVQLNVGIKAAVEDLNASGDYDFTLKPIFMDCQSEPAICASKTRQAVITDKLPLVMGPLVSTDVLPSAEITQRSKVPQVLFTPAAEITDNYSNTFRWAANNDVSAQTVVDYVKANLKPGEKVALVHDSLDFGIDAAKLQKEQLKKAGIEPVEDLTQDPGQPDYTPLMLKLQSADPAYVLMNSSNPADVAKLLKQAKELRLKAKWIGADAPGSIKLAGDAALGYATVSPWFPNNSSDPKSAELTKKLTRDGVTDAGWIAAMAYDATKGVAEAAKANGFSSAELSKGLSSISGMAGTAVGSWTFSADDREGLKTSTIADWTDSGYQAIWPK